MRKTALVVTFTAICRCKDKESQWNYVETCGRQETVKFNRGL